VVYSLNTPAQQAVQARAP